jgi:catechol 2,3-dioxygenase-like lactoylglutathione lyase family enzyme
MSITGIDHLAITVKDLPATIAFYDKLFGARTVFAYAPNGKPLTTQILVGDALMSLHQYGNGIELVAKKPTTGSQDFCFRWNQPIDTVKALLAKHNIPIADGPSPRRLSDSGKPSKSIYFYDPDGNLVELMAAD